MNIVQNNNLSKEDILNSKVVDFDKMSNNSPVIQIKGSEIAPNSISSSSITSLPISKITGGSITDTITSPSYTPNTTGWSLKTNNTIEMNNSDINSSTIDNCSISGGTISGATISNSTINNNITGDLTGDVSGNLSGNHTSGLIDNSVLLGDSNYTIQDLIDLLNNQ